MHSIRLARTALMLACGCLPLTACGTKGPLTLPPAATAKPQPKAPASPPAGPAAKPADDSSASAPARD